MVRARAPARGRPGAVAAKLLAALDRPLEVEGDIVGEVRWALEQTRLRAQALELTETLDLEYASERIYELMRAFRLRGIRLSIDDLGTGYPSLAYLRHLPFDTIKIDRAFVARLGETREDEAIVRAIVTLVHALGKRVVAEGVETPAQLEVLRALGCDESRASCWPGPRQRRRSEPPPRRLAQSEPMMLRYSSSVNAFIVRVRTLPAMPILRTSLAIAASSGASNTATMSHSPMTRNSCSILTPSAWPISRTLSARDGESLTALIP
jgi:hypothetical protein